jgi:hypothetical protein
MDCSDLVDLFAEHGVKAGSPGFVDDPSFLRAELRVPDLLTHYAEFVLCQQPDSDEAERVRDIAVRVTDAVARAIEEHGDEGACVDAALTVSWLLSQLGVWNFVVAGGLLVEADVNGTRSSQRFSQHDMYPVDAGHAWVVAPPFNVVDAALQHQPYEVPGLATLLPRTIVAEGTTDAAATEEDHCSVDLIRAARLNPQARGFVAQVQAATLRFGQVVNPVSVSANGVTLRYVPCKATAQYPDWSPSTPGKVGFPATRLLDSLS